MSRLKETRGKIDVSRPVAPLQYNPFAVLGELDALKDLPQPKPEPAKKGGSPGLRPAQQPASSATDAIAPKKSRGRLVLRRETKDRGGKVVVVISGFVELPGANAVMIADLAKELKGKLGCGGSFDRQEIILQGDRCADVCALLEEAGFRVNGVKT